MPSNFTLLDSATDVSVCVPALNGITLDGVALAGTLSIKLNT